MIKRLLCATLALGSSFGLLLAGDAFTGSWKLDVVKSTFASDNPAPKVVDDKTLVMTQNTTPGASRIYQVSADGKTLTLTQKREDGRERAKMAFSRQ